MNYNQIILGIELSHRKDTVDSVQQLLTDYGCFIRTRLGLHQASDDRAFCSDKGIIILQFIVGADKEAFELKSKLQDIEGVSVKEMVFEGKA